MMHRLQKAAIDDLNKQSAGKGSFGIINTLQVGVPLLGIVDADNLYAHALALGLTAIDDAGWTFHCMISPTMLCFRKK